jgi:hypothetical protein
MYDDPAIPPIMTTLRTPFCQLNRHTDALADWDRAVALDDNPGPYPRLWRAQTLVHLGAHARAAGVAEELAAVTGVPASVVYDAACVCALCVPPVGKDAALSLAERGQLAEKYAARAVALLRRAATAGYKDAGHMKKDSDLDPLRSRDDFKKLIADLEGKSSE